MNSQRATEDRAKSDLDRIEKLAQSNATTQQQLDSSREAHKVAQARVEEALQGIYQIRVGLGLPATPPEGKDLASVPDDINQTFSAVRQAEAALIQAASVCFLLPLGAAQTIPAVLRRAGVKVAAR